MIRDDADASPDNASSSRLNAGDGHRNVFANNSRSLGVVAVLIVLLGMLAYRSSLDKIDAMGQRFDFALAVQKEKLNSMLAPQELETATVHSASNDEFLQGGIIYARDNIDDFESYNITFEFPLYIDVHGQGVGTVLGAKVVLDDKLMNLFATYANGVKNHRIYELYHNGIYFTFEKPVQISEGLSFQYTPTYSIHRLNCADVQKVISDVSAKFYDIEVQPFVSRTRDVAERKKFHVTFAEDSLYQCK